MFYYNLPDTKKIDFTTLHYMQKIVLTTFYSTKNLLCPLWPNKFFFKLTKQMTMKNVT